MHIYEVIPTFDDGRSNVVVAKSKSNAVQIVVNYYNSHSGFKRYFNDDFIASDPIDPNDYPEETVIN